MVQKRDDLTKKYPRLVPIVVLSLLLAAYLLTLDRGLRPDELTGGDLITHQYAQVQGRPSNAPGYPLYVMLGQVFIRVARQIFHPFFNPIQIISLYSTLWGLASLWLLYHLLLRPEVTGQNHWLAALLTLFYGGTYFFWYYSVTTEQYTSAIFQTLLLVWLAFKWERRPTNRLLWGLAFVTGTMAANMLTTLFVVPPLLYLVFTRRPDILKKPKLVLQTAAAGLLPLLSYGFVYLQGARHPEWRGAGRWASAAEWFWQFVSTRQGRDELAPGLSLHQLITPEYPSLIWQELGWLVLLGGLVGWALLGKRKAIFLYASALIYMLFCTAYRFGNWFQVILPLYPLLVLGFGRLIGRLWTDARLPASPARIGLKIVIVLGLVALIGRRVTASVGELRVHQHNTVADTGLAPGWAALTDAEPGQTISASYEEWVALQYLMVIWRAEPAVTLVEPGAPAETLTRRAAAAYPALLNPAVAAPQAAGGSLIRLATAPMTTLPAEAAPVTVDFGGQVSLIGLKQTENGQVITLYWTAQAAPAADYSMSVRLWQGGKPLTANGEPLVQDHQPVWNTYPTSQWRPRTIIVDAYTFLPPPGRAPDQIQLVVYRPTASGFENLAVALVNLPR